MVRAAEVLEADSLIIENVTSVVHDSRNVVNRAALGFEELGI